MTCRCHIIGKSGYGTIPMCLLPEVSLSSGTLRRWDGSHRDKKVREKLWGWWWSWRTTDVCRPSYVPFCIFLFILIKTNIFFPLIFVEKDGWSTPWTKDDIVKKCTAYRIEYIVCCSRRNSRYCKQYTFDRVFYCHYPGCGIIHRHRR